MCGNIPAASRRGLTSLHPAQCSPTAATHLRILCSRRCLTSAKTATWKTGCRVCRPRNNWWPRSRTTSRRIARSTRLIRNPCAPCSIFHSQCIAEVVTTLRHVNLFRSVMATILASFLHFQLVYMNLGSPIMPLNESTFLCSKCRRRKPLNCFGIRPDRKLGHETICRSCHRDWRVDYGKKLKDKLLSKFGAKCATCGFSDVRALQLDHVNGDGWEER